MKHEEPVGTWWQHPFSAAVASATVPWWLPHQPGPSVYNDTEQSPWSACNGHDAQKRITFFVGRISLRLEVICLFLWHAIYPGWDSHGFSPVRKISWNRCGVLQGVIQTWLCFFCILHTCSLCELSHPGPIGAVPTHRFHWHLRWEVERESFYCPSSKVNILTPEELEKDISRVQCFISSKALESRWLHFRVSALYAKPRKLRAASPLSTHSYHFK